MQNLNRHTSIALYPLLLNAAGVFMQKLIISLICCLLPVFAQAADAPEVRDDAPDRHIVVKGDTLWDISGKFFKDPWKWPRIWGMNMNTIRDPHWIYPGDVIILDRANNTLRMGNEAALETPVRDSNMVKLSPRMRATEHADAITSIPARIIGPFLSRPLIIEDGELTDAPRLIGALDGRVLMSNHDTVYAQGLQKSLGPDWQVFRPGKLLLDPDTKEVLGREIIYLGDALVEKFGANDPGDVSTLKLTTVTQEINKGDRLVVASEEVADNYIPRAPDSQIAARVISIYGGVTQAGQNTIITLNKGKRDGLENGHVLALYRKGEVTMVDRKPVKLPDARNGLLFVFRTFDKVSYGLVLQTRLPVELRDSAITP